MTDSTAAAAWQPLDLAAVRVAGPLETRIGMALNHLLAERGRILGGEGFGQAWGADQQGRWIGAVSAAAAYTGEDISVLAETVQRFIGTQAASGFFGQTLNSLTWWGAGRGLIGLVEYWQATGDPAALASATRLGEFYLAHFPLEGPGLTTHHGGHEEGLVALARATNRAEFLTLAQRLPATVAEAFGTVGDLATSQHTHSYLSTLRGMVDVYLATGDAALLARAEREWAQVRDGHMWVTGGISEGSGYAFEVRDETCSVADWLRLSLKLWQATGAAQYLEVAEHVLLNHLSFDQDHSGGFCSYRSVGENPPGQVRDVVTWFCCSMHGLRALLEAVKFIYAHTADAIAVNLFITSEARVPLAGQTVTLRQTADSPLGPVRLSVEPETSAPFTLHLRLPAWARAVRVSLNGAPVALEPGQAAVGLYRAWQPGDTLDLAFEAALRIVPEGSNGAVEASAAPPASTAASLPHGALVYGPLALMLDPTLNIYAMFEWGPAELLVPLSAAGQPFLEPVTVPILGRGALAVPGACFMTLARPAGSPDGETDTLAFLVPVAELTDRWSFTMQRNTPYAVRHHLRLLAPEASGALSARLQHHLAGFTHQRQADTATAGD